MSEAIAARQAEVKFTPVHAHPNAKRLLWELLAERDLVANISHKGMPTWEGHCAFVDQRPYAAWYIIQADGVAVGAIYLTRGDEIGVGIFKDHRRRGYASQAISLLMQAHGPRRYLANIAPLNDRSRGMFQGLGFRHVQDTFALEHA
jgi:RimJ/RimL family protein N-acetyltransferase